MNQIYEHAPGPAQAPYRPPGHHERDMSQATMNEDLKNLIITISRHHDARLDAFEQSTKAQFKGVRAHLEDLEAWKRGMESQVSKSRGKYSAS